MKSCPYCAEEIQDEAVRCKHCGSNLNKEQQVSELAGGLRRSRTDRMLMGICGGIAQQYGIDPTLVRVIVVVAAIFTSLLPVVIAYVVVGLVLPEAE